MLPLELTAQADERTVRSSGLTQSSPLADGAPSWFDYSYEAMPTKMIAGKYRLEKLLGEGGMGAIWQAFNVQLEVSVALKLLRPGLSTPELAARLCDEARAAARLVHPSIVRVFDIGTADGGEPFIVMELLKGEDLGGVLERGPLSAIEAVQLLLPIAEGLSLAHSRGVVHRDLKPDNIFMAIEGGHPQAKLLDFGIAKVPSSALACGLEPQAEGLLGSPYYMSPEQVSRRPDIDHRSDIWSFCVVLYEALSGRRPFSSDGSGCLALLRSILNDVPPSLEVLAGVDPRLSALVQSGLEKDRQRRPSSILELGRALAAWLIEQGVHEDGTGASLAVRWFGGQSETAPASGVVTPLARVVREQVRPAASKLLQGSPASVIALRPVRHRLAKAAAALRTCAQRAASTVLANE